MDAPIFESDHVGGTVRVSFDLELTLNLVLYFIEHRTFHLFFSCTGWVVDTCCHILHSCIITCRSVEKIIVPGTCTAVQYPVNLNTSHSISELRVHLFLA